MKPPANNDAPLLRVDKLSLRFSLYDRGLEQRELEVISALDVELREGELTAIAGSSGSGKSVLAHAILGILPANARLSGEIRYRGQPLTKKLLEKLRGTELALIPQSVTCLDPTMKVGKQIMGTNRGRRDVEAVFKRYDLPAAVMEKYPFELSGCMARRVLVAAAVISGAKLVIADEPTPGLSEALAAEAFSHLKELAGSGCAVMLITHDITMALAVADRITIFYAGLSVETALRGDFEGDGGSLRHPYTRALWRALPQNGFVPLPGFQPRPGTAAGQCRFFSRCPLAAEECLIPVPMRDLRGGKVRCVHAS
jgi:peptide/nickel transport system ATP-binding protein